MSDILSQTEIDALLSAISTGEVKAEEIKSQESDKKIKPYDFKRPNKFAKEQLHTLSMIHENFARLLTTYLSAQMRTLVQVNVFAVEQITYNEFMFSVPNPSLIGVIDFSPLKGAAIMEMNPSIAFGIIDRLLGGTGDYNDKLREPTEIESSIIEKIFGKMTRILSEAWADITEIHPKMDKLETNSQFVQVVSPNEAVALITLNCTIGKSEGMINICIPHIVLEPIITKLSARMWLSTTKRDRADESLKQITAKVYQMSTEIKVELGKADVPVGEFVNLRIGDVIPLNTDVRSGADVYVEDQLKFKGIIGVHHNKMAVKITKLVAEEDRING